MEQEQEQGQEQQPMRSLEEILAARERGTMDLSREEAQAYQHELGLPDEAVGRQPEVDTGQTDSDTVTESADEDERPADNRPEGA